MANDRLTTTCPSCEASVAVRGTAAGKKIECPKCKFQFVVPDGDGAKAASGEKAKEKEKTAPKGKAGKAKAKGGGGNSKVIIGALVGVLALAGLAVGAFMIFGGEGEKKPTGNPVAVNRPQPTIQPTPTGEPGGPSGPGVDAEKPMGDGDKPAGDKPAGEGDKPMPAGEGDKPMPMGDTPKPTGDAPKPTVAAGPNQRPAATGADITNLLPNDARSACYVKMDELAKSTPLSRIFFDSFNKKLFKSSLRFEADEMNSFVHCYVGADHDPFVVIRTNVDLDQKVISYPDMDTKLPDNSPIKGKWHFRLVQSNPFITAVGQSFNIAELLGLPTPPARTEATEKKYAVSLYDSRTMLIAESATLQRFLNDLNDDGFPTFRQDYKKVEIADPTPPDGAEEKPAEGQGGPGPGESGPGVRPGGPAGGRMAGQQGGPGGRAGGPPGAPGEGGITLNLGGMGGQGGPPAAGGGAPRPRRRAIASNPTFRTIEPELKKAMNLMQDESPDGSAVVFAAFVNQRAIDPHRANMKNLLPGADNLAIGVIEKVKVAGLALNKITATKGSVLGYLDYASADQARTGLTENVIPVLTALRFAYFNKFREPLTVGNSNDQGGSGSFGPGGMQGGPGGMPGGAPGGTPGGPGGILGGPVGGRGTGGGRDSNSPRHKGGGQDEDIQKGGLGGPGGRGGPAGAPGEEGGPGPTTGGPGGMLPGGMSGMGGPGEGGFGMPTPTGSRITYFQTDSTVVLNGDFTWKKDKYDDHVMSVLNRSVAQLKGKMTVYSGDASILVFADREVDGRPVDGVLKRSLQKDKQFPAGTIERQADSSRSGFKYPPEQRCSFFVELLPFMDNKGLVRGLLAQSDDQTRKEPWYSTNNLKAAEVWIPELLAPEYPSWAWAATSELIPDGRAVGGTNFVGVAGLSLDAARLNPNAKAASDEVKKKVGLVGYDFGSKVEEVTDGMSNTMYLIQVPPGLQRPWIAGGGATLQGVDDKGADPARPFMVKRPDGSRSTTVLMGDGSVRTVREGVDPAVFRAMATRAGGETIAPADLDKAAPKYKAPTNAELRTSR
jgi:hypothetical protein